MVMGGSRRITTLIGLVLALVVPLLGPSRLAEHVHGVPPLLGREAVWWGLAAAVLLWVVVVERRPLSSIGFKRPTWRTPVFAIVAAVATFVLVGGGMQLLVKYYHLTQNREALGSLLATPWLYRLALVTRAAVVEETLFRGYGIERLQELTGSRIVAAVVTLAVFTYAHLSYWGAVQLMFAGGAGLVLTVLYLWRRDLWSNILAHWLVDAAGLLIFTPPAPH
jgi:membrane protease YdiL (CAAX protease family)